MPTLRYCKGDPDALKACIAAAASNTAIDVAPTNTSRSTALELDNKETLTDPNAIARYAGD